MDNNEIREHLRAALDEIVAQEKSRLHQLYDKVDADITECIEKMRPLIAALNALKTEIGNVKGIKIELAQHGHMALVEVDSPAHSRYSISTNTGNTGFVVEEHTRHEFPEIEIVERRHEFHTSDLVLEFVVNAIGKHVAQQQVITERKK